MMTIVLAALFASPATRAPDLAGAVRDEVRVAIGDAGAEVIVRDLRYGDRSLLSGTWEVALAPGPVKTGRLTRVRGTIKAGARSTWLSAEVEVVGAPVGDFVIARGERVTAQVSSPTFRVSAEAEALGPARRNERVLVRVLASQKTLEGRAVAPGLVEVNP